MQLVKGDGIHLYAQVDTVQQRTGNPAAVLPHGAGRAGAGMGRVAVIAALAGVHGRDQLEATGVSGASRRAADGDLAVLQRLPQNFETFAGKFRQFVQKQNAAVGKAALAGAGTVRRRRQGRQALAEWCGLRKGAGQISPRPCGSCPAME